MRHVLAFELEPHRLALLEGDLLRAELEPPGGDDDDPRPLLRPRPGAGRGQQPGVDDQPGCGDAKHTVTCHCRLLSFRTCQCSVTGVSPRYPRTRSAPA